MAATEAMSGGAALHRDATRAVQATQAPPSTESPAEDTGARMLDLGARARAASRPLARAPTEARNAALLSIADSIADRTQAIRSANRRDLDKGRSDGLAAPLLDRLELTDARIRSMAEGLRRIAALPDPVGEIDELRMRPSGLQVGRMRVPLGVIGIIYESRPNVTADAAGLCLKSGNATILRGGSEALASNLAIAGCIHEGLAAAGLPREAVQVVETSDRAAVGMLITMDAHVDVIVPQGRQRAHRASEPRSPRPDHQAPGRQLPRLHRRPRRPRHGPRRSGQREDLPLRDLRCDGDAAGRARHRAPGAPGPGGAVCGSGGGDPRLRGDPGAGAGCRSGHRGGPGRRNTLRQSSRYG